MILKAFGKNILIEPVVEAENADDIQEAKAIPDELTFGIVVNIGNEVTRPMLMPSFSGQPSKSINVARTDMIGAKILIAKDAGEEVIFEKKKYKVITEEHILCVCSDE